VAAAAGQVGPVGRGGEPAVGDPDHPAQVPPVQGVLDPADDRGVVLVAGEGPTPDRCPVAGDAIAITTWGRSVRKSLEWPKARLACSAGRLKPPSSTLSTRSASSSAPSTSQYVLAHQRARGERPRGDDHGAVMGFLGHRGSPVRVSKQGSMRSKASRNTACCSAYPVLRQASGLNLAVVVDRSRAMSQLGAMPSPPRAVTAAPKLLISSRCPRPRVCAGRCSSRRWHGQRPSCGM